MLRRKVKVCIILLLFYLILVFTSFSNLFFIVDFTIFISFSHSASRKMTLYYYLCFLHWCRPSFLCVILKGCYRIETYIKSARRVMVFNKSRGQDSLSPLVTSLSGLLTVLKLPTHQRSVSCHKLENIVRTYLIASKKFAKLFDFLFFLQEVWVEAIKGEWKLFQEWLS